MISYPDWVIKHKKKGTYINRKNGRYYLYAAHSERVPGTNRVRRISDGYLGRITEEGFIPAKRKLSGPVYVYEYGLSETILMLCANFHKGLSREFRAWADFVMAGGALLFMHGEIRREFYNASWLSIRLIGFNIMKSPTEKQQAGMEHVKRMITDTLKGYFGEAYQHAIALLPLVKVVRMGDEIAIAASSDGVNDFLERHALRFEEI